MQEEEATHRWWMKEVRQSLYKRGKARIEWERGRGGGKERGRQREGEARTCSRGGARGEGLIQEGRQPLHTRKGKDLIGEGGNELIGEVGQDIQPPRKNGKRGP